jgi:arylsulfatase A-like enzyme
MKPTYLFAVLCCLFVLPALAQQQTKPDKPLNVVWLSVEDMSPWIGPYGDKTVPTPNLDRLAKEGVTYDNAFATSPVCAPARSSLITGMYATRIGTMQMRNGNPSRAAIQKDPDAYKDIPGYQGLPPEWVRCFPEHLRAAGYYCTNNSKKDYQFKEPVTVWDESSGKASWKDRAGDQPFFAVFNHNGTHESRGFRKAERDPIEVEDGQVPIPPIYPDTPNVRDAMMRTYNNIARMDQWVGQKMKELEDAGLLDSTVVIFFSDHGVGLPRGKRSCYDTGLRVPLIVRFPDKRRAGTREDRVVSFVDFGPSVLSLAGIDPDDRLDGTPFLGPHATTRDDYRQGHAYGHADRFDAEREQTRSVSDGRFRYTRNYMTDVPYLLPVAYREQIPMTHELYALRENGKATKAQWQFAAKTRPAEEFYDSQNDPWETHNLIDSPEHQDKIAAMRTQLDAWIEDTGDLGFVLPETKLVKEHIWPADGKQPTTPEAQIDYQIVQRGGDMFYKVTLTCQEPGASIGYRLGTRKDYAGPWQVYTGPFETPGHLRFIQVQTHRIGHKPAITGTLLGGE